jgi:transposase
MTWFALKHRIWKPEHRLANDRRGLRYPSDLSDAEWALVAPLIPPARRGGRRRSIDEREVLNAIFYLLATGCQLQALPKDLPPKSTAHFYFQLWDWEGTLERIHEVLYVAFRDAAGREASPSASIIDSQSAKAAQKGAHRSLLRASMQARRSRAASATSSSIRLVSCSAWASCPPTFKTVTVPAICCSERGGAFLSSNVFSRTAGYQGPKMAKVVAATGAWHLEIVKRSDLHRFVVLPKRWIVERTFAWISRNRRLMRDFERRCFRPSRHDPPHAQTLDQAKPLLMNPFFLDRLLTLTNLLAIHVVSLWFARRW